MAALSTYAENQVVNFLLRGTTPTVPSQWFLALYTTNPTAFDTGAEIPFTGSSNYFRQPITFGPPSNGSLANTGEIDFPPAGTTWGNVAYAAIRDAATGGNLLFYGSLVLPRYINAGDVLRFLVGNVTVTVS
jgi:hypothetical protein